MQHGRTYGVDEDTTLAALAGSRPRGRPAAFRHVREQGHLACSLDRDRELTLVPAARSAHPTRPDLPSVGGVPAELIDVLVVDLSYLVLAEEARLPPEHLRLSAARTSWTRSWLAVLPSFRLRCHASNLHPTLREGAGVSHDRAESRRKRRASPTRKPRRATSPDAGRERRRQEHVRGIRAILGVRVRLSRSPPVLEVEFSPVEAFASCLRARSNRATRKEAMKGSQKPKKLGKKPAQKTLKERRTAKRAAAKHASRGLDV